MGLLNRFLVALEFRDSEAEQEKKLPLLDALVARSLPYAGNSFAGRRSLWAALEKTHSATLEKLLQRDVIVRLDPKLDGSAARLFENRDFAIFERRGDKAVVRVWNQDNKKDGFLSRSRAREIGNAMQSLSCQSEFNRNADTRLVCKLFVSPAAPAAHSFYAWQKQNP